MRGNRKMKIKKNTKENRNEKLEKNEFEEEITSKLLEAKQEMTNNSKRYTSEEVLERLKKSIG